MSAFLHPDRVSIKLWVQNPDAGFEDGWEIHASIGHDRGLEMSSWHLALYKDHFNISYVRFGGGHVGPDEGFGDVWDILATVVHDGV